MSNDNDGGPPKGPDRGGLKLDPRHRQFAEEYFAGPTAGNALRCYLRVFDTTKEGTAGSAGHELLKRPEVREYLEHLSSEATERVLTELGGALRPWIQLAPEAQAILVATARGTLRSRLAFDSAREILDRALGKATDHLSVDFSEDSAKAALRAFTNRTTQRRDEQQN
jgi:hypothetical protein